MNSILTHEKQIKAFDSFCRDFSLTDKQRQQFLTYLEMFLATNEDFNLTAITDVIKVIDFHFRDSLQLAKSIDLTSFKGLADIGSGGGFPGIPLKIMYPDLFVVLIEVTRKKINFLWDVINKLGMDNVFVSELDWRTFLRKPTFEVDIFCARASLHTDELLRLYKPGCEYKDAQLVYWASDAWKPTDLELPYIEKTVAYKVGNKDRKLIFFKRVQL